MDQLSMHSSGGSLKYTPQGGLVQTPCRRNPRTQMSIKKARKKRQQHRERIYLASSTQTPRLPNCVAPTATCPSLITPS